MNSELKRQINDSIEKGIEKLPQHDADWVRSHLCEPIKVKLSKDPDGNEFSFYWLVTDNNGQDDSSYRIVYDDETKMFGLECTLANGLAWYMGAYGTFEESILNM